MQASSLKFEKVPGTKVDRMKVDRVTTALISQMSQGCLNPPQIGLSKHWPTDPFCQRPLPPA